MPDSYIHYKIVMSIIRRMRREGIVTNAEYISLEKLCAEKYGLDENDIFRDTDLLCSGIYGNITDDKTERSKICQKQ